MWGIEKQGLKGLNIIKSFSYFQLFLIPTGAFAPFFLYYNGIMEITEKHRKKAQELFKEGYNCAQSVFCAFCDELGMEPEMALKLSSSFGGGMGKLREVCGAVSAMFMIAGIKFGYTSPTDSDAKSAHYELIQHLAQEFKRKNKTIICRELLGDNVQYGHVPAARTEEYYASRPCEKLVADAAEIIANHINKKQTEKI